MRSFLERCLRQLTWSTFLGVTACTLPTAGESNAPAAALPAGYRTSAAIVSQLHAWQAAHPKLVAVQDIGDSWEKSVGRTSGADLLALSITPQSGDPKPCLLVLAGIHADELSPVELAMRLAQHLIEGYGRDPAITRQLERSEIVIVPLVNVDGRRRVEAGHPDWRTNTNDSAGGTGVDLNRNFDAQWGLRDTPPAKGWLGWAWDQQRAQLADPRSNTFAGTGPASEPETRAIQGLLSRKRVRLLVDLHAYGNRMVWPLGHQTEPIPEAPLFQRIRQQTAPGYKGGNALAVLYPAAGNVVDYAYETLGILGFTLEVGSTKRPTIQEVDVLWDGLAPGLAHVVTLAGQPQTSW